MTDGVEKAGDPDTVSLKEPRSRAFWARRFEVPVEQVEAAVAAAGTDPAKVAAHLGKPWPYDKSGIV
jgi:hypothetical protein